jgi:hypothetical protein
MLSSLVSAFSITGKLALMLFIICCMAAFRSPFEPVGYGEYKSLDSTKEHPSENLTRFYALQDRILAVGRLGVFWNG